MKKGDHEKSRKGKESSVMNAGNEIVRPNFYQSVADILHNARSKAYRAVNFVMVEAYWNIGRMIVEEEQQGKERAGYGALLIRNLSIRLTHDFGKGFTETNLKYFRQFYLTFPAAESSAIRHALRPELAWTHYRLFLECGDMTPLFQGATRRTAQSSVVFAPFKWGQQ